MLHLIHDALPRGFVGSPAREARDMSKQPVRGGSGTRPGEEFRRSPRLFGSG